MRAVRRICRSYGKSAGTDIIVGTQPLHFSTEGSGLISGRGVGPMFSTKGSGLISGRAAGLTAAAVFAALVVAFATTGVAQQPPTTTPERDLLTRIRRLTVEGRRAGEGYWSPDGNRLVFQSERELGNPFYQIYTVDLTSGQTFRISPGQGKTTCAFFRPGSDQILFASTHHDPASKKLQDDELAFRASGKERRYAWDYDPEFEIYAVSTKTREIERLTNARGYDAEASYSPDGRW